MANYSPLRYPGGKGKLAPYICSVLEMNGLEGGHYAEPFAGGAAVALELLFSERVKHIHINDLDWTVFAFWKSIVDHTEEFIAKIETTPVTIEAWRIARETKKHARDHKLLDVGFSTFFLNRTNRSGILNGGVIGGLSQNGEYKIDCRFNRPQLIERIRRIGIFRSRITVSNLDAVDFLKGPVAEIEPKSLVYIDPPYYVKGAFLYQNHFSHDDHVRLAETIASIERHKWFVSYDNVEQIRRLYQRYEQEQFSIGYSARNHELGSEVMVFSSGFDRPAQVFSGKLQKRLLERTLST